MGPRVPPSQPHNHGYRPQKRARPQHQRPHAHARRQFHNHIQPRHHQAQCEHHPHAQPRSPHPRQDEDSPPDAPQPPEHLRLSCRTPLYRSLCHPLPTTCRAGSYPAGDFPLVSRPLCHSPAWLLCRWLASNQCFSAGPAVPSSLWLLDFRQSLPQPLPRLNLFPIR